MKKALVFVMAVSGALALSGVASADDAAAARSFKAKCAACHGPDGKGKTKQGEKMKIQDLTARKDLTPDKIKTAINDGIEREKDGVKQEMKPLKGKIPDDQIDELVKYVQGLK